MPRNETLDTPKTHLVVLMAKLAEIISLDAHDILLQFLMPQRYPDVTEVDSLNDFTHEPLKNLLRYANQKS